MSIETKTVILLIIILGVVWFFRTTNAVTITASVPENPCNKALQQAKNICENLK